MERLVLWHRWLPTNDLDDAALARSTSWVQAVRRHLEKRDAEVVAQVGGSVVSLFDTTEIADAVDVALELLSAQDALATDRLPIAIAISVGQIATTTEAARATTTEAKGDAAAKRPPPPARATCWVGEPFDRAQSLAGTVPAGSLVLDVEAQQLVASEYLFSHAVTSSDGIAGELLDRAHPRRRDCRAALTHLRRPTLSPASVTQYQALKQLASGQGRQRVSLVGPHGVGVAQWLRVLAHQLRPPTWLNVIPVGGSLTPLGALAYALRRLQRSSQPAEAWLDLTDDKDAACAQALAALRGGRGMSRRAASGALRHFLMRVAEKSGARAWISLNPASQLDPATIRVVAEASREGTGDSLLFLRMLPGQKPPAIYVRGTSMAEIRMPALTHRQAQGIAAALLGEHADADIARKAALTGGPTTLGVVEAVRSMVSSGEVVHEQGRFRWRRGPGGRGGVVPVETLLEQRLEQLEAAPRRMLEALITVPDAAEGHTVEAVARLDGLSESACDFALELLVDEGFITGTPGGFDISQGVRKVASTVMPSARRSELHRFVGQVLEEQGALETEFGRATVGYFYADGGRPEDAVRLFMETAQLAGKLGWTRMSVRLAAAAVQTDPTARTREAAARLTRALTAPQPPPIPVPKQTDSPPVVSSDPPSRPDLPALGDASEPMGPAAVQRAVQALLARDVEEVERCIELAVASGLNEATIGRLRAMSALTRGDPHGALHILQQAEADSADTAPAGGCAGSLRERARALLAEALVRLEADQAAMALRVALRALAVARGQKDGQGEQAALRTLAACFRRLGRDRDAMTLEQAV